LLDAFVGVVRARERVLVALLPPPVRVVLPVLRPFRDAVDRLLDLVELLPAVELARPFDDFVRVLPAGFFACVWAILGLLSCGAPTGYPRGGQSNPPQSASYRNAR
jgi:hypothetical protein